MIQNLKLATIIFDIFNNVLKLDALKKLIEDSHSFNLNIKIDGPVILELPIAWEISETGREISSVFSFNVSSIWKSFYTCSFIKDRSSQQFVL